MRLACIGIGSNAIRLLTAGWDGEKLTGVCRERRGTRLFAGLRDGALTQESMDASVEAIGSLGRLAREQGAQALYVFATSAVRDAKNGQEFAARAEAACGARVEIITGEEEAVLSYIGASEGESCGVIDIGGGSTEFTLGQGEEILAAVSLQMGAVRMNTQRTIRSQADYLKTRRECVDLIRQDASALLTLPARMQWAGVGGTMTTLGAMEKGVALFDPEVCEGMRVRAETVTDWGMRLSAMTLEARRHVVGLMPQRADIIPSGIAILDAAMHAFDVPEITLSAHGNMDGYLKKKFQKRG